TSQRNDFDGVRFTGVLPSPTSPRRARDGNESTGERDPGRMAGARSCPPVSSNEEAPSIQEARPARGGHSSSDTGPLLLRQILRTTSTRRAGGDATRLAGCLGASSNSQRRRYASRRAIARRLPRTGSGQPPDP